MVQKIVQKAVQTKVPAIVLGATLLAGVSLAAAQLVVPGRAGVVTPAKLSPTAHPPVPNDLSAMWLVPSQSAKPAAAMTNFVRGVRLLEEDDTSGRGVAAGQRRRAVDDPGCRLRALLHRPGADEARSLRGSRSRVLGPGVAADCRAPAGGRGVSSRRDPGNAEGLQGRGRRLRGLVAKKLAQPQVAWLRLGLAADLAGLPMRSVEALQRAYYDYPTTAEADRAAEALDKQDVDLDAALAPKELARAETLFQARRWTAAKASYDRVKPFVTGADRDRVAIRIAAADIALGRHREGRDALRPYLTGALRRRGELPLRDRDAWIEAERRAHRAVARVRREISDQPVRRRNSQQPGVGLHHRRPGRRGGRRCSARC